MAVLISISSRAERRAALVDALTPPSSVDEADDDLLEEELLFTSPFTLLTVNSLVTAVNNTSTLTAQAHRTTNMHGVLHRQWTWNWQG